MARKVKKPFIRVDALFFISNTYGSLPKPIANDAYLFLLALAGKSFHDKTDGRLRLTMVQTVADAMHVNRNRMLDALAAEGVLTVTGDTVQLDKQGEWQLLAGELLALQAERVAAGSLGGQQKASNRLAHGVANDQQPVASASPVAEKSGKQNVPEENRREKREENNDERSKERKPRSPETPLAKVRRHLIQRGVTPELLNIRVAELQALANARGAQSLMYLFGKPEAGKIPLIDEQIQRWREAEHQAVKRLPSDLKPLGAILREGTP